MFQLVCMDSAFVCIHVCLFMSNSLDVVPKNSDMVQLCCFTGARTHTRTSRFPLIQSDVKNLELTSHFLTPCLLFVSSPPSYYTQWTTLEHQTHTF